MIQWPLLLSVNIIPLRKHCRYTVFRPAKETTVQAMAAGSFYDAIGGDHVGINQPAARADRRRERRDQR